MTRAVYKIYLTESEIDMIKFALDIQSDIIDKIIPEYPEEIEQFTINLQKTNNLIYRLAIAVENQNNE